METDDRLHTIRTNLFYGLLDYTKSFPDFSIPQRFELVSPREGKAVLRELGDSLVGERNLLIYVHLPFCSSECVFCNAFPQKSNADIQKRYIESILEEIEIYRSSGIFEDRSVECLYLGGGTPTAFSASDIDRVILALRSATAFSESCSITCEAHSRDLLDNDRIEESARSGINRISIGCQTFDEQVLKSCRRVHRVSQVTKLIRDAQASGLRTNIDMMTGLPGQTLDGVKRDLAILGDVAPDSIEYMRHEIVNPLAISLYRNHPELLVDDEELFWMTYETQKWMEEKGYEQNGSFTGESYFPYRYHWLKGTPFLSFGCRSRSFTEGICCDKHEDLSLFFRIVGKGMPPIARVMRLNQEEKMYRSLFLSLQTADGLDSRAFETRFEQSSADSLSPVIDRLARFGCIEVDDSSIRLSRYGRYFVEDVCCFIVDEAIRRGGHETQFKRMPHSSGAFTERLSSRMKIQGQG
jgi:oxygen-independent coproporphyrinogen-3 oxidase